MLGSAAGRAAGAELAARPALEKATGPPGDLAAGVTVTDRCKLKL
jgi:hypothetical protein